MEVDTAAVDHLPLRFHYHPVLHCKVEVQHFPRRTQRQSVVCHERQHVLYYCDDDDDV